MSHLSIVVPLTVFALAWEAEATANDDSRVASLRAHAVVFRSIKPDDGDFADFEPLKESLSEARIVQLGEQSHGDGATFHAKTRLIRFLHQEMGFDVLAFESGLYDCRKAWEQFATGSEPRKAAEQGIFGIWTQSKQVQPLLSYIAETAKTECPLELCGFDCQFTAAASRTTLLPELQAFIARLPDEPVYRENGAAVTELIGKLRQFESAPEASEQKRWLTAFETLREALAPPDVTAVHPAGEIEFWRQFLKSTAAYARIVWGRLSDDPRRSLAAEFNPRDAQMADNLIWLARRRYPQRKIIVWAATMHIQRNPHLIDAQRSDLNYTGIEPMGHHLTAAFGNEVFTIGFTAYEGQAGLPWGQPSVIEPAPRGSLEDLCVRAGLDNAFVSFRGPEMPAWLRQPLVSRPLGHCLMRADWTQVLDGMVFIRTMTPSTRAAEPIDPELQQLRHRADERREKSRDLVANIEADWKRAQERLEKGQPYADKVTFGSEYDGWKEVVKPTRAQITEMRQEAVKWFESQKPNADLEWRVRGLLAMMLVDEGDRDEAHRQLDAALESYPAKTYRQPSSHSFFQHLVNQKAMLLWDDDGMEAARAFATHKLANDSRCHYFFYLPWLNRLRNAGTSEMWPAVRAAVLESYEQRIMAFPEEAAAIRERIAQLAQVGE